VKPILAGSEKSGVFIRNPDALVVKIKTPTFSPVSWIQQHASIKTPYGTISEFRDGNDWILECNVSHQEAIATFLENSLKLSVSLKRGGGKIRIPADKLPKISAMEKIKSAINSQKERRTAEEESRRAKRISEDTDDTILSPALTDIENASIVYTAEVNGGTLRTLLVEPGVNKRITYSNDAKEMNMTFGLRAASNFLSLEIEETWANSGAPLQPITITTITDVMTYSGSLTPSSFSGNTSVKMGFLAKASVHAAQRWISLAALNGESDNIMSVASAQMVSKRNRAGTGSVELINAISPNFVSDASIEPLLAGIEPIVREYVVAKDDEY
jgi:hypothetical protein